MTTTYIILKLDNFYALEWNSALWKLMFWVNSRSEFGAGINPRQRSGKNQRAE